MTRVYLPEARLGRCMIKIFRGGRGCGWGGGSSERCLKWGGGVGVVKGSFQRHFKIGGG